jgi:hypothetical protein
VPRSCHLQALRGEGGFLVGRRTLLVSSVMWSYRWSMTGGGGNQIRRVLFSVKSSYSLLFKELNDEVEGSTSEIRVFQQIWRSPAPYKIIALSWQLLHDRISTRDNLARCDILRGENSRTCVVYTGSMESSTHFFLHYEFASCIWADIFRWLGIIVVMPYTLLTLFE